MPRRNSPARAPVVALLIETSNAFSRELLHGIRDWMQAHMRWTIHFSEFGRGSRPPDWLRGWHGDGIIARIETPVIARTVRRYGVPVVNVSAAGLAPEIPSVRSDSAAIAAMAARHLIERGFQHFAYCGDGRFAWSNRHGKNFAAACAAAGHTCSVFPTRGEEHEQSRIERWLASLPRPVGIMACYDIRGQQVLDACRSLGLRVPDEVAVIGQHNDELLCELCDPPLSSVIPGARQAGFEAAQLLDLLMRGKRPRRPAIEIPPVGVAIRQSTDTIAVADPRLGSAMRHLREHACEPLSVDDLARAAGLSRTLLERLFRKHFGVSPYEQVLRLRMARADLLLATTSLSIAEIADRVGCGTVEHFTTTYTRRTGMSPGARRRMRRAS